MADSAASSRSAPHHSGKRAPAVARQASNIARATMPGKAYPLLVVKEFPPGAVAVMLFSMAMALMSSLDSVFNSASTILTLDVYKASVRPGASERELVLVGRAFTVLMVLVSVAWVPVIEADAGVFYLFTQSAMTHLAPVVVAVFVLGLAWPRVNETGALAGFSLGKVWVRFG